MKKNIILILLILFFTISLKAQELLSVNAGENKHFCFQTDYFVVNLGGNPTASGGTEPYTYYWWTNVPNYSISDTTTSNPSITLFGGAIVYVEVTDADNNTAIDSVVITMSESLSNFIISPYNLPIEHYISQGDSVWITIDTIVNIIENVTCLWLPSTGLENCDICSGFWAKPNTTTSYSLKVTDEFGCYEMVSQGIVTHLHKIYVNPIGIEDNVISNTISIYPNPVKDNLYFNEAKQIEVIDIQGKVLLKTEKAVKSLNVSNLSSGIYFVKFIPQGTHNQTQKFVKE